MANNNHLFSAPCYNGTMLKQDYYNDFFEIVQQKINFSFFEVIELQIFNKIWHKKRTAAPASIPPEPLLQQPLFYSFLNIHFMIGKNTQNEIAQFISIATTSAAVVPAVFFSFFGVCSRLLPTPTKRE